MDDVAALCAELDEVRAHFTTRINDVEARLNQRIADETVRRGEDIDALRVEWRDMMVALQANTRTIKQVANDVLGLREESKFQTQQLRFVGQAMDLLLKDSGLAVEPE